MLGRIPGEVVNPSVFNKVANLFSTFCLFTLSIVDVRDAPGLQLPTPSNPAKVNKLVSSCFVNFGSAPCFINTIFNGIFNFRSL